AQVMADASYSEQHFGLTYIATGEDTKGHYFQCSTSIPAGDEGPPMHKHANESEGFYVVAGELVVEIDGRQSILSEGDFVNVLPGQAHKWSNQTKKSTELIITFSPAGIENMFRELDEPDADFVVVGKKFGMSIVEE
nr:cupin domain-containing protein [Granulosicoccus sp.]